MTSVLRRNRYILISAAAVLVLLGIWEICARAVGVEIILPTFTSVCTAFGLLFTRAEFYISVGFTLLRCLVGYVIGFGLGVLLGLLAGRNRAVAAALTPIVTVMRTVPVVAIALVLTIWIGSSVLPSVVGIMLVFPIIYGEIKTAAENVGKEYDDALADLGAGFWTSLRTVYLPMVLPHALSGISTTFGMNIKAVISAEVLAYTVHSIGYQIYFSKANFLEETPTLFAWIMVAVLLSVIFEALLRFSAKKITSGISWLGVA